MDSKPLIASRTFWAALLTVLAAIIRPFGLALEDAEVAQIADALTVVVGFVAILWGRYKAAGPVTVLPAKKEPE